MLYAEGGGIGPDLEWITWRPGFFLQVRVLSRLFRRLFLKALGEAFHRGQLQFFGDTEPLKEETAFRHYLTPLKDAEWVIYAKKPFGGPQNSFIPDAERIVWRSPTITSHDPLRR